MKLIVLRLKSRRLTEALLHRDFQLSVTIPDDRLCPPVPNRLNYILWMQDIVHATSIAEPEISKRIIKGVDMYVLPHSLALLDIDRSE
uniref:Putative methyltransferase-like protein n=1 Tax=Sparassis latifolia TaxID=1202976 RepID=A0A6B9LTR0_9APHY|nr:putative methyltransferase-like protein [Sparassis latifolia]